MENSPTIHVVYRDCYEAHKKNPWHLPGIYRLQTRHKIHAIAYCLEGGWTVIQSRGQFENPIDYFSRGWKEYVTGFGDPGMC